MSSKTKNKGPIVDPALCRCCRSIKKCRVLTADYEWNGNKEVYSEMFMDCFGLLLSHLDGDTKESSICATCVGRLRDACAFRRQVLSCEEMFLNTKMDEKDEGDHKFIMEVKAEPVCGSDNDIDTECPMEDQLDTFTNHDGELEEKQKISHEVPMLETDADALTAQPPCERDVNTTRRRASRTKRGVKRDLISKVHKLRDKLDKMLDKPTPSRKLPKTALRPSKKTLPPVMDRDYMVYQNAVSIVQNSYVCPFLNRISIYYCYYCKDQFTNPNELRDHTLSHEPKTNFESMMENKKIPKIDITRIDCRLCPERINDLETFKRHITSTHGIVVHPVSNEFLKFKLTMGNLTCTECADTFPYFDVLKKHMVDHFGTFICDICGAAFLEQASLRTHIKSHSKVETQFPCEVCGKNLKSKYSKYLHVATVHEKKPIVNCYKCEESFLSYALRNRHLIEVHGDKRTFPCKLCDKVYNRRKTLMEHNRRYHLKVYRHHCDLCDQRFYLPSRLKEHMAAHTGERNFHCEFCDKSYPRLQSLQEHIRSHSNERRFKCDICNSTFTQNVSLKNHLKSHHHGYDMDQSF